MDDMTKEPDRSGGMLTEITIAWLIYIVAATAGGLTPVLPQIRTQFADAAGADFLTKALVTVFGLSALVGSPMTGRLLKRWGLRNVFLATVIVFIGSGLGGMVSPNLEVLVCARFVGGLAAAVSVAAVYTYILTCFPAGKREWWLGFVTTLGSVWAIVASVLAGELGHYNWRLAFLINLVALPLLVLVPLAFRKNGIPVSPQHAAVARDRVPMARMAPSAIVGLISGAIGLGMTVYVPFQLNAVGITDPRAIARFFAFYAVVNAASALLYGYLRRFLAIAGVNFLAFAAAGLAYGLLALWPIAHLRLAELAMLGLGTGLLNPNLAAFAGRRGDAIEKAQSIGIAKAGYFASGLVMQAILAILTIRAADISLLALACICIPGALIMARVPFGPRRDLAA